MRQGELDIDLMGQNASGAPLIDEHGKIIYGNVIRQYPWIVEASRNCILSPDSDGLLCGLLMRHLFGWRISGFYDGKVMALQKDLNAADCIFLDMEIFRSFTKSMGQHMLMWDHRKDLRRPEWANFANCISPNNMRSFDGKRTFKRKYPLGTIHLLLGIVGSARAVEIRNEAICPLLYTDGTFKNMFNFPENTLDWLEFLCADDRRSPLYKVFFNNSYTTSDLMRALKEFFAKVKEISGGERGGDKIKVSNGDGEPVNFRPCGNGLFALDDAQVAVVNGFLSMLADLTGWTHDPTAWTFSELRLFRFDKGTVKPNGRNFDALMARNPLSWAMTSGQTIEYTVERDTFR